MSHFLAFSGCWEYLQVVHAKIGLKMHSGKVTLKRKQITKYNKFKNSRMSFSQILKYCEGPSFIKK